jgi:heme oxygenase
MQSSDPRPALEPSAIEPGARRTPASLRQTLRAATAEIHARLHLHTGFAAIQNGTIDLVDYRSLLERLYGFHVAFEAAVGIAGDRSGWLRDDLAAVGIGGRTVATIPRCTALRALETPPRRLGALYVVEGSTLGGRHLARNLDPLLGSAGGAGRRFFLGRGADTNTAWNAFLARMTASAESPAERRETVAAAVETFRIFQEWLHGWRGGTE